MTSKYSITISNQSGATQTYVVFAEPPTIRPVPETIQTNIMFALRGVAGDGGQAYFTVPSKSLIAMCGTSNPQGRADLVQFEVLDSMPVTLGAQTSDGKLSAGITCDMVVSNGSPRFAENQTAAALGEVGAFCVRTKRDFTYKEALSGSYVVGLGISPRLIDEIGPSVLFTPQPNELYIIKPSKILYVAAMHMDSRDPITPELKEKACAIDFSRMESSGAFLVHNSYNEIIQQAKSKL